MRIKKIHIKNFKSLVDFELEDLKPFCAFVGPNASGKSNIFEALEFTNFTMRFPFESPGFFNGKEEILSFNRKPITNFLGYRDVLFDFEFEDGVIIYFDAVFSIEDTKRFESIGHHNSAMPVTDIRSIEMRKKFIDEWRKSKDYDNDFEEFADNFSRIFVAKSNLKKLPFYNGHLAPDADNLAEILFQIFQDDVKKDDFLGWLRIIIPEFQNIKIEKSGINKNVEFFLYEKASNKPFHKHLISDGTYNILALMAAVYQSNQPQFLCIEEPENGLHPQAIQLLVDFFREKCEEEGHHIWLNTHSQTLVKCLDIDEIILVNKINGETKAKQLTKADNIDIQTDEAWLTNALGGGVL